MIVDTSALVAIISGEPGWQAIRAALVDNPACVAATSLTEFQLAAARRSNEDALIAGALMRSLLAAGLEVIAFERRHADITAIARARYGKGNGRGGLLNFGDLMVYAIAKDCGAPLLCTGRDFASTDLELHPASRSDP